MSHYSDTILFVKHVTRLLILEVPLEATDVLLSVPEAARRLGGISKWTVHAWLSQGRLQRTKVGGRTMIRESELAKVIEDGGKSRFCRREPLGR
jgi:excisionase family DNA binding protein